MFCEFTYVEGCDVEVDVSSTWKSVCVTVVSADGKSSVDIIVPNDLFAKFVRRFTEGALPIITEMVADERLLLDEEE